MVIMGLFIEISFEISLFFINRRIDKEIVIKLYVF